MTGRHLVGWPLGGHPKGSPEPSKCVMQEKEAAGGIEVPGKKLSRRWLRQLEKGAAGFRGTGYATCLDTCTILFPVANLLQPCCTLAGYRGTGCATCWAQHSWLTPAALCTSTAPLRARMIYRDGCTKLSRCEIFQGRVHAVVRVHILPVMNLCPVWPAAKLCERAHAG
eukprot:scaffold299488_cov17-Tisochrysis_lutea.AAC.1